jgi:hypothetical protein
LQPAPLAPDNRPEACCYCLVCRQVSMTVVRCSKDQSHSGRLVHGLLDNSAVQFTTKVSGAFVLLTFWVVTANRLPSWVTSWSGLDPGVVRLREPAASEVVHRTTLQSVTGIGSDSIPQRKLSTSMRSLLSRSTSVHSSFRPSGERASPRRRSCPSFLSSRITRMMRLVA